MWSLGTGSRLGCLSGKALLYLEIVWSQHTIVYTNAPQILIYSIRRIDELSEISKNWLPLKESNLRLRINSAMLTTFQLKGNVDVDVSRHKIEINSYGPFFILISD